MNRRSFLGLFVVIASLTLVGCGEGDARQVASNAPADRQNPAAEQPAKNGGERPDAKTTTTAGTVGATVALEDDVFDPVEVEVAKGEAVAWTWKGKNPHNVAGPGFKSKIQTSGTFRRTFAEAGSFDYRCEVHPTMTGKVVVTG